MRAVNPRLRVPRVVGALLTGALLTGALLAGCSTAAPPSGSSGAPVTGEGRFTGPWADLFQQTYAEASSDDERAALEDGEISAAEYAYFQDKIVRCLAELDVKAEFGNDGALTYSKPQGVSQDAIQACNADNGIRVLALRDAIQRNPAHLDETQIMLDCLKRTGAVGPGYSRSDLDNGVDLAELGTTPEFMGCAADPLNFEATGE